VTVLTGEHAGKHEPREHYGARQVELDDRADVVLGQVVELALRVPAGVVDEHVMRRSQARYRATRR
jgi:hypothetical protein